MIDLYPKAYKEVYVILQQIPDEDVKKIPSEVLKTIEVKMDNQYDFKLDENIDFEEQNLLRETRALLAVLYRDYWANEVERERIIAKQKYDMQKLEEEKREKYNPNDIFKNNKEEIEEKNEANIVVYKESIFKKIINKLKSFFKIGN